MIQPVKMLSKVQLVELPRRPASWSHLFTVDIETGVLSSKSGILWIYGAFKTTGNSEKARSNHHVSDLQGGALERGPSFRLGVPSWMTVHSTE